VIDTDQQATLSEWHNRRQSDTPPRAELPFSSLASGLNALATKHKAAYCLIDTDLPP
jgi:chromosome partitioning protein